MKKLGGGIAVTAFLPAFTFCSSNINNGFKPDVFEMQQVCGKH
jgi:hypothetical protein